MPQPSYPFASARVKSRENAIMTREKALRLAGSDTPEEAMQLLAEWGYAGAEDTAPERFEACLTAELDAVYAFVEEITPDKAITDLFFLPNDYRNLKLILKQELAGGKGGKAASGPRGLLDVAAMQVAVQEKRYDGLPPEMADALEELDRRFAVRQDASLIGLTLDRAYAAQVNRELADVREGFVRAFFALTFDFANLTAFLRLRRIGAGRDVLARAMLPGGNLPEELLKRAYEAPADEGFAMLARGPLQRELAAAYDDYRSTGSFALFHKVEADSLIRIVAANRQDMFSVAPVLAYLVGKTREIEVVRMILLAKLNGIASETLLGMLPNLL